MRTKTFVHSNGVEGCGLGFRDGVEGQGMNWHTKTSYHMARTSSVSPTDLTSGFVIVL